MPKQATCQPHLSTDDFERRCRSVPEPHERSWWQILWLRPRGQGASALRQFEMTDGFDGPYGMVVAVGVK
jgi:hypothetical protein